MKRPYGIIVLLFTLLSLSLYGQTILKVESGFALIDTDKNIGKVSQKLHVYRIEEGQVMHIGQVKIIEFRYGKTAARVLKENPGFKIAAGDFISKRELDAVEMAGVAAAKKGQPKTPVKQLQDEARTDIYNEPIKEKPVTQGDVENTIITGESVERKAPESRVRTRREAGLLHIGLFGGVNVPATLQSTYKTSPSFGAAVRFFGRSRHTLILDFKLNFLNHQTSGNEGSSLSSILLNYHAAAGFFIKTDLGIGYVFGESSSLAGSLGLSMDFFLGRFLLSPGFQLVMYKSTDEWHGYLTGGITLYFGVI